MKQKKKSAKRIGIIGVVFLASAILLSILSGARVIILFNMGSQSFFTTLFYIVGFLCLIIALLRSRKASANSAGPVSEHRPNSGAKTSSSGASFSPTPSPQKPRPASSSISQSQEAKPSFSSSSPVSSPKPVKMSKEAILQENKKAIQEYLNNSKLPILIGDRAFKEYQKLSLFEKTCLHLYNKTRVDRNTYMEQDYIKSPFAWRKRESPHWYDNEYGIESIVKYRERVEQERLGANDVRDKAVEKYKSWEKRNAILHPIETLASKAMSGKTYSYSYDDGTWEGKFKSVIENGSYGTYVSVSVYATWRNDRIEVEAVAHVYRYSDSSLDAEVFNKDVKPMILDYYHRVASKCPYGSKIFISMK